MKTLFKNYIVLLQAHNEKKQHVKQYFESKNVRVMTYPMFTADYTFMVMPNHILNNTEPIYFGNEFLIERKSGNVDTGGGFCELKGNLTTGHKAFKAEFKRMHDVDNIYLLIENAKNQDSINLVPSYKVNFPQIFYSFIRNRNSERKKPINLIYTPIQKSGEKVMLLIYNYLAKKYN
jgi:hypothetical protein